MPQAVHNAELQRQGERFWRFHTGNRVLRALRAHALGATGGHTRSAASRARARARARRAEQHAVF